MIAIMGCSNLPYRDSFSSTGNITLNESGDIRTNLSIAELLNYRRELCNKKATYRESILRNFRKNYIDDTDDSEKRIPTLNEKLETLLIASCDPAKTPGILHEALVRVMSSGKWPDAYTDFFDVLVSQQQSYSIVEKKYYDMRFQWQTLELEYNDLKVQYANTIRGLRELRQQHEETIRGLSEIEAEIDSIENIENIENLDN